MSYLILSASVITDRHSRPFLNAFALVRVTSRKSRFPPWFPPAQIGRDRKAMRQGMAERQRPKTMPKGIPNAFLEHFYGILGEVTDRY